MSYFVFQIFYILFRLIWLDPSVSGRVMLRSSTVILHLSIRFSWQFCRCLVCTHLSIFSCPTGDKDVLPASKRWGPVGWAAWAIINLFTCSFTQSRICPAPTMCYACIVLLLFLHLHQPYWDTLYIDSTLLNREMGRHMTFTCVHVCRTILFQRS